MWGEIAINNFFFFVLALGHAEKNTENSKELVNSCVGDFSLEDHEGLDDWIIIAKEVLTVSF